MNFILISYDKLWSLKSTPDNQLKLQYAPFMERHKET